MALEDRRERGLEDELSSVSVPPSSAVIDRRDELAAVRSLLLAGETRLLTLTGPAGVGKSRLAQEAAQEMESHFADGIVCVDLAPARDRDAALAAVAEALGFWDLESSTIPGRLQEYLRHRELLLLLDNVDSHLAGVSHVARLLEESPHVTVLVTSRTLLRLRSEQVYRVPPLALPELRPLPPLEVLGRVPSVALFLQRAEAIDPTFALTEENARAVAELCVRLDGLPLAIELAAARINLLSPQMILERLDQRLSLLDWEAHDRPERQRTLRSALDWSYELLPAGEQGLFRRLGVFAGSFSLRAASAIDAGAGMDALEGLSSLVDWSLVQVQGTDLDDARYVLLESVREYALERLTRAGELEETGRIHAVYYLELAEWAGRDLTGADQSVWFARLESALENMRAATRWLLQHGDGEAALRLAAALGYFWVASGHMDEGRSHLEEALARAPDADPGLRARGMSWLGLLLVWLSDDTVRPRAVLTDALALARTVHDTQTLARTLMNLAVLDLYAEQFDRSRALLEESLACWREVRDPWGIAYTRLYQGAAELRQDHRLEAIQLLEESLAAFRALGDSVTRGFTLAWLVYASDPPEDVPAVLTYLRELLMLSEQMHDRRLLDVCSVGTAWLLREEGDPDLLARLLGAARALQETMGLVRGIVTYTNRLRVCTTDAIEARVGRERLQSALVQGRSLPFRQIVSLIHELLAEAAHAGESATALSRAESGSSAVSRGTGGSGARSSVPPTARSAIAQVPVPAAVLDLHSGSFLATNAAFDRMFAAQNVDEIVPAENRDDVWSAFDAVAARRLEGYQRRGELIGAGGKRIAGQILVHRLTLAGAPDLALGILVPADRDGVELPALTEVAGSAVDLAVIVTDHEWRVEHAGDTIEPLLGYRAPELDHQAILGLVHPDDALKMLQAVTGAMAARQSMATRLRLKAADGSWRDVVAFISTLCAHKPPRLAIVLSSPGTSPTASESGRSDELEQHLWRIAMEVRAAGLLRTAGTVVPAERVREFSELSERQWEIVTRLAGGQRVSEIARAMYLSQSTVRNHLTAVFRKLGVHSQRELLAVLTAATQPPV